MNRRCGNPSCRVCYPVSPHGFRLPYIQGPKRKPKIKQKRGKK